MGNFISVPKFLKVISDLSAQLRLLWSAWFSEDVDYPSFETCAPLKYLNLDI